MGRMYRGEVEGVVLAFELGERGRGREGRPVFAHIILRMCGIEVGRIWLSMKNCSRHIDKTLEAVVIAAEGSEGYQPTSCALVVCEPRTPTYHEQVQKV
jgi:hypothetical protein